MIHHKEPKQLAKLFELAFIEVDNLTTIYWITNPAETGVKPGDYSNVDNFIKDSIEKEFSFKETHRGFCGIARTQNSEPSFYFLKSFYEIIKELNH